MRILFFPVLPILFILTMAACQAAPALVEAEANPQGQVLSDPSASGGKFVTGEKAYDGIVLVPLPSSAKDPITVWVRYRGVAVQLKGVDSKGTQSELNWLWDRPSTFRWASFGSHTRKELGDKILVIRGSDSLAKAGIDAVVVTSDPNFNPDKAYPELTKRTVATDSTPVTTTVNVNWAITIGQTTPLTFGTNAEESIFRTEAVTNTRFKKRFIDTGIRLIRVNGNLLSLWTNPTTKSWDSKKIKASYEVFSPNQPQIIQNIQGWPAWMAQDKDGLLAPSEYDRYAAFCAELVDILNVQQKRKIAYWEPFNEADDRYKKADKLDELWKIYNKAAKAMKAKDPSIKVGGPVMTYDDTETLTSFLKAAASNVDFISWHRYATGNKSADNEELMSIASGFGDQVKTFRALTAQYIPSRRVPLLLGEYNINYSWDSGEERQNTYIGAVWFASVLKNLAEAGIEMSTSWNLKDGIYGMMDQDNNLRPSATVFTWANKYLVGDVAKATTNQPSVEVLAVHQPDQSHSLLLINKGAKPAKLNIKTTNQPSVAELFRLDAQGTSKDSLTSDKAPLVLPAYSLALLHLKN